jgi:proline dehydrogenase
MGALPKAAFSVLAGSGMLKRLADRYGLGPTGAASRYVAGQTPDEAVAAARAAERAGRRVAFAHLGPAVTTTAAAADATRTHIGMIQIAAEPGRDRHMVVLLSQLGLAVDRATALDNLRRLLDAATPGGMLIRLDLDSLETAGITCDTAETLWQIGYRNLGITVCAVLRRSIADVDRFSALGMSVRLLTCPFRESRAVAYRDRREIDAAYRRLIERLLTSGHRPVIGTHDPGRIDHARRFAAAHETPPDGFEFAMRQGVRPDLQQTLAADGYTVRIYLPFGQEWFPYVMRRLGERPVSLFRRT